MTFERFAMELRETFQNYRNGADEHWQAVARRALELALLVEGQAPPAPPSKKKG
jgi:hypothetical protein